MSQEFDDLVDQVSDLSDNFDDLSNSLGDMTDRPGQLDVPLDDQTLQAIKGCFFAGVATLVAGSVTVYSAAIFSDSTIIISRNALGGTAGHLYLSAQSGGTFTIQSTSLTDTSSVNYIII